MRWQVTGADRESGKDRTLVVEADTKASAVRRGGRQGLMVESVRPADDDAEAVDLTAADSLAMHGAAVEPEPAAGAGDTVGFRYAGPKPTRPRPARRRRHGWGLGIAAVAVALVSVGGWAAVRHFMRPTTATTAGPAIAEPVARPSPVPAVPAVAVVTPPPPVKPFAETAVQPMSPTTTPTTTPTTNPTTTRTTTPTTAPAFVRHRAALAPPKYTVSADDLLRAYADDRGAAESKYDGQRVAVTGVVDHVAANPFGTTSVVLAPTPGSNIARSVDCSVHDAADVAGVRPGDRVTLVGTCDGVSGDVQLSGCRRPDAANLDSRSRPSLHSPADDN